MVKRKSCHGSNVEFRVQILVGLLTHGVCGVAVTARLAVNQEVRVQLPSDTLTRVCSWESRQPPKLLYGVRLLALVLVADVARPKKAPVL